MRKIKLIAIVAISILGSGCYHEDSVTSELGKPHYVLEDSSDPSDHAIYQFWKNTGVYMLYNYSETDYLWNISALTNNTFTRIDRAVLPASLTLVEKTLTDYYTDAFMKKYFPLKVLLASTIDNSLYDTPEDNDQFILSGRSYLAIGRLREEVLTPLLTDVASLTDRRGCVQGTLWADIIYANGLIRIPDSFFEVSSEYYGASLSNAEDKSEAYVKSLGFWRYDSTNRGNDYMLPDRQRDIYDFVYFMASHTTAEITALMASSENLRLKYTLLRNAIKEATGVDLQDIGNKELTAN